MSKSKQYSRQAIQADADFSVSIIASFASLNPSPLAVMSLFPYLALFLFESQKTLANHTSVALTLDPDIQELLTASRHSIKLFEDTHRDIAGQRRIMREEILPSHKDYFLNNTWFPPARIFETDLGLYVLNNSLFSSTHAYTYLTGIPPKAIRNGTMSKIAYEASVAYGRAFAALSSPVPTHKPAAIQLLDNNAFPRTSYKDRKSDRIYPRLFNGPNTPDLNATLLCQLALIRFVTDGYTLLYPDTYTYSLFKIRFITAYQVTSSLRKLLAKERANLTRNSIGILEKITQTTEANSILNQSGRSLRNLLVHYTPAAISDDTVIDNNLLDSTLRLAGSTESATDYERIVAAQLDLLHDEMITWCNWTS